MPDEDYPSAGQRLYKDADHLLTEGRHATATHLFDLAQQQWTPTCW
ncbi:hypothetical protein [Halomonas sp. NO4]|nr:hypothetical protein [Halomonas sp. NO4]